LYALNFLSFLLCAVTKLDAHVVLRTLPGFPSETYKFVRWQLSQPLDNGCTTYRLAYKQLCNGNCSNRRPQIYE